MPYIKGTVTGINDLVAQIVAWSTDAAIHDDDAWVLMRSEPWPRGTIFRARGVQEDEYCYIGLLPLDLQVGSTYKNWLMTDDVVGKHLVWSATGLNKPGSAFTVNSSTISVRRDKFDPNSLYDSYSVASPEIINKSCKALVFGVFKQYVEDLNWDEQPGAVEFGDIGLKALKITGPAGESRIRPPLYPGIGYPGFGMDHEEPRYGFFPFWAVKDANRITIVVQNAEQWDMGHAGLLIPYHSKMQYPFPAVIAGSSSGLIMNGLVETSGGGAGAPSVGAMVDYTYANWMLSRGMPPFATSLVDSPAATSQVCLCLPDGTWRYFADWVQGMNSSLSQSTYTFTVTKPVRPAKIGYYIKPTCVSLAGTVQIYPTKDTYQVEPLELIQDDTSSKNMYGRLWRMYWPSQKVNTYGEITVNGKLHLMLPNCWEGRPWYIPSGTTGVSDLDALLQTQQDINDYTKQMNCLIRLED